MIVCAVVVALCGFAPAQYGGGRGTAEDPYRIYTPEQMNAIGAEPNDWDKHFRLMADIDLSAYTGTEFNLIGGPPDPHPSVAPPARRDPGISAAGAIGAFTGVFDGNGYTISNFTYESAGGSNIGLFTRVDDLNASIKNLGLIDATIRAETGSNVGALVGWLTAGRITNCYAEGGTVRGGASVGGLVGGLWDAGAFWLDPEGGRIPASATLSRSYSSALVVGDKDTGGLVGTYYDATITSSRATGTVIGRTNTGGLVGAGHGGVANCYATATTIGAEWTGGLVGNNDGAITFCYAAGVVVGTTHTGGLTGAYYPQPRPNDYVVGCFWDVDATGQRYSEGGQGRTTSQMQVGGTYLSAGWDLVGETVNGTDDIWWLTAGGHYPKLWWEVDPTERPAGHGLAGLLDGAGTADNPYLIHTADELNLIGLFRNEWDKCYRLVAGTDLRDYAADDLNLIGEPVIEYPAYPFEGTGFTGVFDGNGHVIRNFTWSSEDERGVGLFASVASGNAEIRDLGLVAPHINASSAVCAGALVGALYGGVIRNCYVEGGSVAGDNLTGGLVGFHAYGTIRECYSTAVVIGGDEIGGLVGRAGNSVKNCYTRGIVMGGRLTGGLAGGYEGVLTNCYSTSLVVAEDAGGLATRSGWSVTGSFWDVQTSGVPACDPPIHCGGQGKTTAEMKDPNTFIAAGWDFFGPADGYADIWTMDPETGYPILWWQVPESEWPPLPAFAGGTGTAKDPYRIASAEQLNSIRDNARLMVAHFVLVADIDLTGLDLVPIGSEACPFAGVFDGDWRTISNVTCIAEDKSDVGVFGYVHGGGALIKDLGLIHPVIDVGTGAYAGALAGCVGGGRIKNCYATGGSIAGDSHVGGLVGFNGSATIRESFSVTRVFGRSHVGGLTGRNVGAIINCYSTGQVTGDSRVGGLVGTGYFAYRGYDVDLVSRTYGTIAYSYAAGAVRGDASTGGVVGDARDENLTACLWNVETTGQLESDGGTGKTTAEMQTAATFLAAGWDFVGEAENGTDDVWWILEGQDYPRLWWELDEP